MQHFLQGCIKKGCSGCFATHACGGGPRKDVFTPDSALAVSALPAEPAPHTCPRFSGTRGWKQLSTDSPGGVTDPEYPELSLLQLMLNMTHFLSERPRYCILNFAEKTVNIFSQK